MRKKHKKNSKEFNKKFKKRFLTNKSGAVIFFTVIILLIVAFGSIQANRKERQLQVTINDYTNDNKKLREQNEVIEDEKERIQDMNLAMNLNLNDEETEDSVREIARSILGMIGNNEYYLQESDSNN